MTGAAYRLVVEQTVEGFERQVSESIRSGAQLVGGVSACYWHDDHREGFVYMQAVVFPAPRE
jgi:hypothetical protein